MIPKNENPLLEDTGRPISVQLKVVKELPKNVSKENLYSVQFDEYFFDNVCGKRVHYKKKYDKIIHYLYTTNEPTISDEKVNYE